MYVVVAAVQVNPGKKGEFLQHLEGNARGAATTEPDCLRFDVIQDGSDPDRIWFCEAYTSEAAFEAHQQTPHFLKWHPHLERLSELLYYSGGPDSRSIYPPDGGWG